MPPLARRNLFHDRVRLTVTLTGIVFAIVLIVVQIGLFIGFTSATSNLIEHSGADLWIGAKGLAYLEQAAPFSERKLQQVRATPGVSIAEKYILTFSRWQRPNGRKESIVLVGLNPDVPLGGPWNLTAGRVEDLKSADGIIVDELYRQKLGVTQLGQVVEINGHRARIVGFTQGIRSFTTSPYVFASFKNAQTIADLGEDRAFYLLVKAAPGTEIGKLRSDLAARLRDVDIYTTAEFSRMTQFYWMFTTGAGIAVLLAAALGLVVGIVIVAQTIYATTMDHLREFGTLKAMGASNGYIYRVIIQQAALSAVMGYVLGMVASVFIVRGSREGGAAILFPWELAVTMFFLTLLMCIGASLVSINKVTRIDPAMVFKG
ncbi:MAG: ABC transporter permease [Acidobacteria bacterium]|nr:ABC transporter permease [Acidobacteriota bacterium]